MAIVAHELRNPLVAMWYTLEASRLSTDGLSGARDILARQLRKALRLVDDLLEFESPDLRERPCTLTPVDLVPLIARAVQEIGPRLQTRNQILTVDVPAPGVCVLGEVNRLEQVLANLLDNSCRYTPAGGHIFIGLLRETDQAVLRVRDDGLGIRFEDLPRVFDPFFRAERSAHGSSGVGIGLALTRQLVSRYGGTIEAHSEGPCRGSEFIMRLPVSHP